MSAGQLQLKLRCMQPGVASTTLVSHTQRDSQGDTLDTQEGETGAESDQKMHQTEDEDS